MSRLFRFRHYLLLNLKHRNLSPFSRCQSCDIRRYSSKEIKEETNDKPEKFLRSKAHDLSVDELVFVTEPIPWYQPPIIVFSLLSFVIYCFFIREENDIDMKINYVFEMGLPAMEEEKIQRELDVARANNEDTRELELKLAYLRQCKDEVNQDIQQQTQALENKYSNTT